MPKRAGRNLIMQKNNITIASAQSVSYVWNGEPITVTDADSSGIQELMNVLASQSIEFKVSGLSNTSVLADIALNPATSKYLTDITLEYVGETRAISGPVMLLSYEETGEFEDAMKFSASFKSAALWTYTA